MYEWPASVEIVEDIDFGRSVHLKVVGFAHDLEEMRKRTVGIVRWNEEFSHYAVLDADPLTDEGELRDIIMKARARCGMKPEIPTADSFVEQWFPKLP